jgi:hypothetical protein
MWVILSQPEPEATQNQNIKLLKALVDFMLVGRFFLVSSKLNK